MKEIEFKKGMRINGIYSEENGKFGISIGKASVPPAENDLALVFTKPETARAAARCLLNAVKAYEEKKTGQMQLL